MLPNYADFNNDLQKLFDAFQAIRNDMNDKVKEDALKERIETETLSKMNEKLDRMNTLFTRLLNGDFGMNSIDQRSAENLWEMLSNDFTGFEAGAFDTYRIDRAGTKEAMSRNLGNNNVRMMWNAAQKIYDLGAEIQMMEARGQFISADGKIKEFDRNEKDFAGVVRTFDDTIPYENKDAVDKRLDEAKEIRRINEEIVRNIDENKSLEKAKTKMNDAQMAYLEISEQLRSELTEKNRELTDAQKELERVAREALEAESNSEEREREVQRLLEGYYQHENETRLTAMTLEQAKEKLESINKSLPELEAQLKKADAQINAWNVDPDSITNKLQFWKSAATQLGEQWRGNMVREWNTAKVLESFLTEMDMAFEPFTKDKRGFENMWKVGRTFKRMQAQKKSIPADYAKDYIAVYDTVDALRRKMGKGLEWNDAGAEELRGSDNPTVLRAFIERLYNESCKTLNKYGIGNVTSDKFKDGFNRDEVNRILAEAYATIQKAEACSKMINKLKLQRAECEAAIETLDRQVKMQSAFNMGELSIAMENSNAFVGARLEKDRVNAIGTIERVQPEAKDMQSRIEEKRIAHEQARKEYSKLFTEYAEADIKAKDAKADELRLSDLSDKLGKAEGFASRVSALKSELNEKLGFNNEGGAAKNIWLNAMESIGSRALTFRESADIGKDGDHTDSAEYLRMKNAVYDLFIKDNKGKTAFQKVDCALAQQKLQALRDAAQAYVTAKQNQFGQAYYSLFASTQRKTRIDYAEKLVSFANGSLAQVAEIGEKSRQIDEGLKNAKVAAIKPLRSSKEIVGFINDVVRNKQKEIEKQKAAEKQGAQKAPVNQ